MKKHLPPLKALPMFDAAARHLNFRLAAEELNLTQGAVAQQVRGLEEYLGQDLFERKARGLVLTPQGNLYHQDIKKALATILEASKQISNLPQSLTLTLTPSLATKWLMPRMTDFTDKFPGIEVKIMASEKLTEFERDDVDLAIRLAKPPFAQSLIAEPLLPLEIAAYGSPTLIENHPQLHEEMSLDLLATIPLLHDAHDYWPLYRAQLQQTASASWEGSGEAANAQKHLHFNQTALAIEAAVAGQGLVLAPKILVEREVALGSLVPIPPVSLSDETEFYLVYPRRAKMASNLLQMIGWLKEMASQSSA